jgi:hypothetical protein
MKTSFTLLVLAIVSLVCVSSGICVDPPDNVVINGDFELQFQSWSFWTEGGAVAERQVVNKNIDPIDGENIAYVKVTNGGGASNHIQFYQGGITLNKDKKYTACIWAYNDVDQRPANLAIHHHENPWTGYANKNIAFGTSWAEYTLTFTQPVSDNNVRVNISLGGSKGDVWVDHVRIYEGEYFDDEVRKPAKPKSVDSLDKLTTAWGNIKSSK